MAKTLHDLAWKDGEQGVWVTYYSDSVLGTRVFATELDGLRDAHANSAQIVFLPIGFSIREAEARPATSAGTDTTVAYINPRTGVCDLCPYTPLPQTDGVKAVPGPSADARRRRLALVLDVLKLYGHGLNPSAEHALAVEILAKLDGRWSSDDAETADHGCLWHARGVPHDAHRTLNDRTCPGIPVVAAERYLGFPDEMAKLTPVAPAGKHWESTPQGWRLVDDVETDAT